jgi:hypothetical protein
MTIENVTSTPKITGTPPYNPNHPHDSSGQSS